MRRTSKQGATLVELLVMIAICGALVALLLPAVQAARESARRVTCSNHLRHIGLAAQMHHDTFSHFPTGGWGFRWLGDPDRGFGQEQPGGWIYNVLPFLGQQNLRGLGQGANQANKREQLRLLASTPMGMLHCPSRRRAVLYPYLGQLQLANSDQPSQAAKCDYAGNGGDTSVPHALGGPPSLDRSSVYRWPDAVKLNGVFYVRSAVRGAMVGDGLSQTYLVGEKHVATRPHDFLQRDPGDDQTLYLGDDRDIRRWTEEAPRRDSLQQVSNAFGSAHAAGAYFAFGDGSIRLIPYSVNLSVHQRLGNRNDGLAQDISGL
jgi:hypothetical protein